MEPEPVKATVEQENKIKPELINKDDDINKQPLEKNTPRLSSSSSASSSLSLEFAVNEKDLSPGPGSPNHPGPCSMLSASQLPETGPHLSPELSTDGYDPNRIPASIFSSKASNSDGWSLASNESLFSIHMGNNSFSRDHAILYEKSDQLGRLDDWNGSHSWVHGNHHASEANNENEFMSGGLPTVIEETSGGISRVESFSSQKGISVMMVEENRAKGKMTPADDNAPDFNKGPHLVTGKSLSMPRTSMLIANRLSDDSGNSSASFAFPVLVGDGVKTGSSRKHVTDNPEQPESQEASNTPQQARAEQGGWYSRFCCCWSRCC